MTKKRWQPYRGETITGTVLVQRNVYSPQVENKRDLYVYLPPSYSRGTRRYPVLYMHDGQNLFDEALSHSGEWRVDETMQRLAAEGIEAIVVGVPNAGDRRLDEYSPFRDRELGAGGDGDAYLDFLVETVKGQIDGDFRTHPGREHTILMGSSMGGLISLYAFFRHPDTFGAAGVMSPAVRFAGGALLHHVAHRPFVPGKLYVDIGTRELEHQPWDRVLFRFFSRRYLGAVSQLRDLLLAKGYRPGRDLLYVEEKGAPHHESAWARRLPAALRFLLG